VALVDAIPAGTDVALDTDAIIYLIEEHERFLPIISRYSQ